MGNRDPPAILDVNGQLVDLLILEGEEEVAFYKRVGPTFAFPLLYFIIFSVFYIVIILLIFCNVSKFKFS